MLLICSVVTMSAIKRFNVSTKDCDKIRRRAWSCVTIQEERIEGICASLEKERVICVAV